MSQPMFWVTTILISLGGVWTVVFWELSERGTIGAGFSRMGKVLPGRGLGTVNRLWSWVGGFSWAWP